MPPGGGIAGMLPRSPFGVGRAACVDPTAQSPGAPAPRPRGPPIVLDDGSAARAGAPAAPAAPAPAAAAPVAGRRTAPVRAETGNAYTDRFLALWNDIHNPPTATSARGHPVPRGRDADRRGARLRPRDDVRGVQLLALAGGDVRQGDPRLELPRPRLEEHGGYIIPTHGRPADQRWSYTRSQAGDLRARGRPAGRATRRRSTAPCPSARTRSPRELAASYGRGAPVYGMHWLIDVDNWYGFGRRGDGATRPSYINTFQRGPQESVWETDAAAVLGRLQVRRQVRLPRSVRRSSGIPPGSGSTPTRPTPTRARSRRSTGPRPGPTRTAAARSSTDLAKAPRSMGDWLRYSLFDKYFKTMGCTSPEAARPAATTIRRTTCCPGTTPGAARSRRSGGWAWRIGASSAHGGYQNPLAAYALSALPRVPAAVAERGARLGHEPRPAARVLPVAAVGRGRHRGRRHQQLERPLRDAARRDADLLRHGLRRGARLPRPAEQRVVRLPGLVDGARRRSTTT